ncbi:hypothetical protein [Xanthobacter flavus]|uniref:hypothetical protein n=1 Tax=Xanthobacter flavus TaxID=281 RepID=UPI003728C1B6
MIERQLWITGLAAAVVASLTAFSGSLSITKGGANGLLLAVLGVGAAWLLTVDHLHGADRPATVNRWSQFKHYGILLAVMICMQMGWLSALLPDSDLAFMGLLGAMLFNGIVFSWALTATIGRRRRENAAEDADRRRRRREMAAGTWRAYPDSAFESRFDAQHGPDPFATGHAAEHRSVPHE